MKRIFIAIATVLTLSAPAANAFDIKGLLKGAASAAGQSSPEANTALGILGGLLGETDVTLDQLEGKWQYKGPAVAFQSDNMLQKAGGIAAAQTVEKKLSTYYAMLGVSSMTMTVEKDGAFTVNLRGIPVKGTIEKGDDGNFVFSVNGIGRSSVSKVPATISASGADIDVTFDATKLMEVATKILSASKNSTLNMASSLLGGYDGMNVGFKLSKCSD